MSSHRVVVKLGGSIVTRKDKPLSLRTSLLDSYAGLFSRLVQRGTQLIIVLGGGSYGHYYVALYRRSNPSRLVSKTSRIMAKLALLTQEIMEARGLDVMIYPPHALCEPRGLEPRCNWRLVEHALKASLTPLLYGDVYPVEKGYWIVSGDELAMEAACSLGASRVVYATDVDGVYDSSGRLVRRIDGLGELEAVLGGVAGARRGVDVTGGMRRKLEAILRVGCRGLRVYIVNGLRLERVEAAVRGLDVEGTIVNLA